MAKERDHRSKFKSSAEVLQNLLSGKEMSRGSNSHMADQFSRWKLWMNWSDVVGPTTAECCEPVAFHQGVLWLWVKNSTWLTQLNFMSETIKNTINLKYASGMVKEIRLTTDRKNVPQKSDIDFKNNLQKFIKK
jgi:predicted nucleic acid-binding Zn ribbon protein